MGGGFGDGRSSRTGLLGSQLSIAGMGAREWLREAREPLLQPCPFIHMCQLLLPKVTALSQRSVGLGVGAYPWSCSLSRVTAMGRETPKKPTRPVPTSRNVPRDACDPSWAADISHDRALPPPGDCGDGCSPRGDDRGGDQDQAQAPVALQHLSLCSDTARSKRSSAMGPGMALAAVRQTGECLWLQSGSMCSPCTLFSSSTAFCSLQSLWKHPQAFHLEDEHLKPHHQGHHAGDEGRVPRPAGHCSILSLNPTALLTPWGNHGTFTTHPKRMEAQGRWVTQPPLHSVML